MPPWREKATQVFPEFASIVRDAEDPYSLWGDLLDIFNGAYGPPPDESLIKRIYEFADWCIDQPQGTTAADDLTTCVAVSFYETFRSIPTRALTCRVGLLWKISLGWRSCFITI